MSLPRGSEIVGGVNSAHGLEPRFIRRLIRRPIALACILYLLLVAGVALVAPFVWPDVAHQEAGDLLQALRGPSAQHPLGTDSLGRDVLERLLVGTRVVMVGVVEALVVAAVIGVAGGLVAGFFRGRLDAAIGWVADLFFSMPGIVIVLLVLAVFPLSMTAAMITVGVLLSPGLIRVVRSATLGVREELYVAAALVSGLSRTYIIARHVLPRVAGAVIVQLSLLAGVAIQAQAGLAFLNLVVPAPAPSWGGMIADGIQQLSRQPWLIWPPGLAIVLTTLALGLLADAVRDVTVESWSTPVGGPLPARVRQSAVRMPHSEPHPQPRSSLLAIEGLFVAFSSSEGPRTVVEDMSLEVGAGEVVGLVGESGCGKSATAMSVLGLLPGSGHITAGQMWFDGEDLSTLSQRDLGRIRGRRIGLVSQEPMVSLNPAFRVGWQLAEIVRHHHGIGRREARARVIDLLASVHLPDPQAVARRYPHELSGGMAQRVAIARALAGEPDLLIADEPTTALDVTVQAEILDVFREIQRDRDMAILLVTHDWGVVADICQRVVVMYAGQVVERGEVGSLFAQPCHPYTEALLASNPHQAADRDELPVIPGTVPKPGQWPTGCRFHPRCRYATAACTDQPIALEEVQPARLTRCIHHDQVIVPLGRAGAQ